MHTSIYNFRNSNRKYTELLCLSSNLISSFSYSKLAGNIHYSLLLIQYCHKSARSPALQADSLPSESTGEPKNTGVGSLSLLQGIFPTQELNRGLLHCRKILYQLSHKGSPRILEWVAYPFSSRSSEPGIEPGSPILQADSLPTELPGNWLSAFSKMF